MPILNYTTKVPAGRTISEIITLLSSKGASSISQEFAAGKITAIHFTMPVGGVPVIFLLPSNVDGVYQHMTKHAEQRFRRREQAERVSWRILKDWVEAQIALVESNQAEMGQVFMPYAQGEDGRTAYQHFLEGNQKRLGSGGR